MALLLLQANATVTICHSRTDDLARHTLDADLLVAAVGLPGVITADMVKQGATVIDVGITRTDAGLVGDVEEDVAEVAALPHAGSRRRRPDDDCRPARERSAGGSLPPRGACVPAHLSYTPRAVSVVAARCPGRRMF